MKECAIIIIDVMPSHHQTHLTQFSWSQHERKNNSVGARRKNVKLSFRPFSLKIKIRPASTNPSMRRVSIENRLIKDHTIVKKSNLLILLLCQRWTAAQSYPMTLCFGFWPAIYWFCPFFYDAYELSGEQSCHFIESNVLCRFQCFFT